MDSRVRGNDGQVMGSALIIGAGLAGAACANAFAHAGFNVFVYEQNAAPAAGASGVPLAMFAPSISADDAPHSRFLRSGVHHLLGELHRLTDAGLLAEGTDWAMTGVTERCIRVEKKLPYPWLEPQDPPALQSKVLSKASTERSCVLFHGAAGWVNPARLVAAWLAHASITVQTHVQIANLVDVRLKDCDVTIVACGYQTPSLVPGISAHLQSIRGQVEYGRASAHDEPMAPTNGMGHWIEGAGLWLAGATFQRGDADLAPRVKDTNLNFEKLATLKPELSESDLVRLRAASVPWVGIRTAQKNRAPLVERIASAAHPNTWICTGLGSRGLSLAALCASNLLTAVQNRLTFV